MSANLRTVIAASRVTTPRLRPRPVSRFESRGPTSPEFDPEEANEREPVSPGSAPMMPPGTAPVTGVAVVVGGVRVPGGDTAAGHRGAVPRLIDPTPIVPVGRSAPTVLPPQLPVRAPAWQPNTPLAQPPTEALAAPVPELTRSVRVRAQPDPVRSDAPAREVPSPPPPNLGVLVAPPTVSPTLPAQQARSARRRTEVPQPAPDRSPAPDVHVTIGRIEVRATPAATPPTHTDDQPPTRSAVVGLDEYLAQRGSR